MAFPSSHRRHLRMHAAALAFLMLLALACGGGNAITQTTARGPGTSVSGPLPQYDSLRVRFMRATADAKAVEVGRVDRPVSDFRDKPISLLVRQTSGEKNAAPSHFEERFEIGSERVALPPLDVDCAKPATCVGREWLELDLAGPAGASLHLVRDLYIRTDPQSAAPSYRRYTIVAVPGSLAAQDVGKKMQTEIAALKIEDRQARADAIQAEAKKAPEGRATAQVARLDELDTGASMGQLLALGFAAQSDMLTDRLAASLGVTLQRNVPRILITGAESEGDDSRMSLSLDLRLDEVGAVADDPAKAAAFQYARGMQESALEGAYMRRMAGSDHAVSTAILMNEAANNSVPVLIIGKKKRGRLASLGLPAPFAALAQAAIDRGHRVAIPKQAIDFAGRPRWGFWDIDPTSGRTIGVMEGGQHQGMVEMPVTTTQIALNPRMGFVLGLEVGMISSQWTLAALILEYGEITPAVVQELIDILKNVACSSCPAVKEGKTEPKNLKDCAKEVYEMAKDASEEDEKGFCERYQDGFMCGVGLVLLSLPKPPEADSEGGGEGKVYTIGCAEFRL